MKTDIHPVYQDAKVTCACGNSFSVGSTKKEIKIEICSNCHPFYTGSEKTMDSAGRVEKFKARAKLATPKAAKTAKTAKAVKETPKEEKKEATKSA
jgi:large subunit ribosomal protein L31